MSTYDDRAQYDPREDKLPKWAQEKLSFFRTSQALMKVKLSDANPITEDTLVVTDRYDEFPTPVKVGRRDNVTFFARKFDGYDYFDVRLDGDDLLIHAGDPIDLHQQSGNVVRVKFMRGTVEDARAQHVEAVAKGWSQDEIRQDKHLGHIPRRNDVTARSQSEIEAGTSQ